MQEAIVGKYHESHLRIMRKSFIPYGFGNVFTLNIKLLRHAFFILNQRGRPFVLEALLLLKLPDVLTFQKLLLLLEFGEPSHQLLAETMNNLI